MASVVNPALTAAMVTDVEKATALFNESLTYLRLASDHAKFIRNYFDPTQEQLFRAADRLAVELDQLRSEICALQEPVGSTTVVAFVIKAAPVIQRLIAFKRLVANLIRTCQTQQLLPAHFIEHLAREAEFFLSIVSHVMGGTTTTRGTLDLPGPAQERVATVARTLMDVVPMPDAQAADFAYTEFWGKHHMEHAEALTIFLRPQQTDLIRDATRFQKEFAGLQTAAREIELSPSLQRIEQLDRDTIKLSTDWRNWLVGAENLQRTCKLQTNFPQRLTEHIRIETDILQEAAERAARRRRAGGAPVRTVQATGATFQSLQPKPILCS